MDQKCEKCSRYVQNAKGFDHMDDKRSLWFNISSRIYNLNYIIFLFNNLINFVYLSVSTKCASNKSQSLDHIYINRFRLSFGCKLKWGFKKVNPGCLNMYKLIDMSKKQVITLKKLWLITRWGNTFLACNL